MENLRFDKERCFHVLVFYTGHFIIKEIENIFYRVLEIAWKHSSYGLQLVFL